MIQTPSVQMLGVFVFMGSVRPAWIRCSESTEGTSGQLKAASMGLRWFGIGSVGGIRGYGSAFWPMRELSILVALKIIQGCSMSRKLTPVAIAYDFDGTLAPGNMQEYDFIPALNMKSKEFWGEVKKLAIDQAADEILAYMWLMLSKAQAAHLPVRKSDFKAFGSSIDLFPGVSEWFDRINAYGKARGCKVEHFIISSGLREMIEGTSISKKFKKIYGSGFMFDHNGVAHWPAVAMNYTTKTQYIFRINKGSLDVHDNSVINKFVPKADRPIPFENMLFIGDGETDIPCMRLVKDQGGHAIAVYNPGKRKAKETAIKLVNDGRATLHAPANYEPGSQVEQAVQAIIDKSGATARIAQAATSGRRYRVMTEPTVDPLQDLSE